MKKTPALLTLFNPTRNLKDHLDMLYQLFDQVILVDNGSRSEIKNAIEKQIESKGSNLKVILNRDNLGVATALNQGFQLAIQLGYKHLITLDQDSMPASDMAKVLMETWQNHPNQANLAIIAPNIIEKNSSAPSHFIRAKNRFFFERIACQENVLRNVSFVITSGSMYNLELYSKIGPFRDDFFIDSVDSEYCLRAISKGYEISVASNARLEHKLGNRQQKFLLGKAHSPTFHPPFRWYYINRNRIAMIRLYGRQFPYWALYEIATTLSSAFRMLFFEDQRPKKLKAFFYGIRDGFWGRMGEMPTDVRNRLGFTK